MAGSNRTEVASALLAEIESWSARTGTKETVIGHALRRHPGLVALMRKRLQVSPEMEVLVRQFMEAWPKGYSGELPQTHVGYSRAAIDRRRKREYTAPEPVPGFAQPAYPSKIAVRIMRQGLEEAVNRIDGLKGFEMPEGVAEASVVDGRPYGVFLADIIGLGLRCWREDRAEDGLTVA